VFVVRRIKATRLTAEPILYLRLGDGKRSQLLCCRVHCESGAPLYVFPGEGVGGGVVDENYGLWFLTVNSDKTALMNVRSWTLFRRFKLCKIITFQSARYGYLVLLLEHACISVMLTLRGKEAKERL
jgi:hypothetical protein